MKRGCLLFTFLVAVGNLFGQECEVAGAIVDSDNQRIIGANILIKGTPNGTVTNQEGEFMLRLPAGKTALIFAFVEYKMITQTFLFHKDSSYVLEVKLIPEKNKKRGAISVTSHPIITGK
jgi:hypothetical protein